jgi:hypothetical protein
MEFLLGLLTGLAVGFLWGVWKSTQSFIERIIERPDEIREIMDRVKRINNETQTEITEESTQPMSNEVKMEFHQGVCYIYDQNDQFLAQGATAVEAINRAEQRFPGLKLAIRTNTDDKSSQ